MRLPCSMESNCHRRSCDMVISVPSSFIWILRRGVLWSVTYDFRTPIQFQIRNSSVFRCGKTIWSKQGVLPESIGWSWTYFKEYAIDLNVEIIYYHAHVWRRVNFPGKCFCLRFTNDPQYLNCEKPLSSGNEGESA